MATPKNKAAKASPHFLRPAAVEAIQEDKDYQLKLINSGDTRVTKSDAAKAIKRLDKQLEQAPPDLTPEQRDKAQKRLVELEAQIKDGMLSHEEMRRCPDGAVDQHIKWQKRNKRNVLEWKNILVALHKGIDKDEATDLFNVDRLRPRTSNLSMDGAIVPETTSRHFMNGAYDSGHPASVTWEEIFGTGDAEKDAALAELRDLKAKLAEAEAAKQQQNKQAQQTNQPRR